MQKIIFAITLLLFSATPDTQAETVMVKMKTEAGDIILELYADKAPLTVANFLRYVDGGHFEGASFYRTVRLENDNGNPKIEVIQGGIGDRTPPFPEIPHESTDQTGILHTDGVISMARGDPGTAAGEFFITIGDQPALDAGAARNPDMLGFAAFGRVIQGMNVVRKIHNAPSDTPVDDPYIAGQIIENPIKILGIDRLIENDLSET